MIRLMNILLDEIKVINPNQIPDRGEVYELFKKLNSNSGDFEAITRREWINWKDNLEEKYCGRPCFILDIIGKSATPKDLIQIYKELKEFENKLKLNEIKIIKPLDQPANIVYIDEEGDEKYWKFDEEKIQKILLNNQNFLKDKDIKNYLWDDFEKVILDYIDNLLLYGDIEVYEKFKIKDLLEDFKEYVKNT